MLLVAVAGRARLRIARIIWRGVGAAEKLRLLGELAASGALRVPIQGVYSIDQTGDAFQAFQQGTRGKLVLDVGSDPG